MEIEEVGPWSEEKHKIIQKYSSAYTKILDSNNLKPIYIDAFSGSGVSISRSSGEVIPGSPLSALQIDIPFEEYHFIDIEQEKTEILKELTGDREDIYIYSGDCNELLPNEIFPRVNFEEYRRALCLLDPKGLHLDWEVIESAGGNGNIEIFVNFPVMDINLNVLLENPEEADPEQMERFSRYWGDDSWQEVSYEDSEQMGMFGQEQKEKVAMKSVVDAFVDRLTEAGNFNYATRSRGFVNSRNAPLYYILFGGQEAVALNIVEDILENHPETDPHWVDS